jgi:hypothetical protein
MAFFLARLPLGGITRVTRIFDLGKRFENDSEKVLDSLILFIQIGDSY